MFKRIRRIELQIETLKDQRLDIDHPSKETKRSIDRSNANLFSRFEVFENDESERLKEKILDLLERAFPNPMSVNDLAKYLELDEQIIFKYLIELEEKNLVKHLDVERQQWTRVIIAAAEEETHSRC